MFCTGHRIIYEPKLSSLRTLAPGAGPHCLDFFLKLFSAQISKHFKTLNCFEYFALSSKADH